MEDLEETLYGPARYEATLDRLDFEEADLLENLETLVERFCQIGETITKQCGDFWLRHLLAGTESAMEEFQLLPSHQKSEEKPPSLCQLVSLLLLEACAGRKAETKKCLVALRVAPFCATHSAFSSVREYLIRKYGKLPPLPRHGREDAEKAEHFENAGPQ